MIRSVKPQGLPLVQKTQVSDTVAKLLEDYIVNNELQDGDKLPSERELCETLGVGTRTVRKVLQQLETRGIIETFQGKGSFVVNRGVEAYARHVVSSFRFLHHDGLQLLVELIYVRQIIEAAAIDELIQKLSPKTLANLEATTQRLSEAKLAGEIDEYNAADLAFHRIVVNAADNKLLSAFYDHLRELLQETFERTGRLSGAMEQSLPEHDQILDMIRAQNAVGAKAALLDHLGHTAESIRKLAADASR